MHLAYTVSLSQPYCYSLFPYTISQIHHRYCGMHSQIPACLKFDIYKLGLTRQFTRILNTDWQTPCTVSREKAHEKDSTKMVELLYN